MDDILTQNSGPEARRKTRAISDYKSGSLIFGLTIEEVFYSNSDKEFIIVSVKEDNKIHTFGPPITSIQHLLAESNFLISKIKNKKIIRRLHHQVASAINSYLLGEVDTSMDILSSLLQKLHNREMLRKKITYIGVFFVGIIFMLILSFYTSNYESKLSQYSTYISIATFGSIGGFISLNLRLNAIEFDETENTFSYVVISIYKFVFALLVALISFFLIESDLILTAVVQNNHNSMFLKYTIASLAGFSESLLPNIFLGLENQITESQNDSKN